MSLPESVVGAVMSQKVVTLEQEATVLHAARAMSEGRVGCIVVTDEHDQPVGIVTDRDLVCNAFAYCSDLEITLGEIMSTDLLMIEEKASLEEAATVMEGHGVRRLVVVRRDPEGHRHCVGILSLDDLVVSQRVSIDRLSGIVQSQVFKRGNLVSKEARKSRVEPGTDVKVTGDDSIAA